MSYESIAKRNHESALRIAEYREIAALNHSQDAREVGDELRAQRDALKAQNAELRATLRHIALHSSDYAAAINASAALAKVQP